MANTKTSKAQYTNFLEPGTLNLDVVITISGGRKTVKNLLVGQKVMGILSTILLYVVIVGLALIVVFPFYFMIITSLKQNSEILADTQTLFPLVVMWTNYVYVFQVFDFLF